ncbi:sensor histidine kinase [Tunturibacter empetritectus]|uniref:histidine kinase n=1 Tax=Tunturiibacter lichenicola TaxID=2051959 RepID=A0A7W8N352_9BACT|nr:HAMP domain-containing sensor histidine kinase [Edaphobacter lichenicola]MBB5343759.1 signal transduction histidine kinase [Edaphobacter lichenicola]
MNRNSLRARVTAFYVAMLAMALIFFSIAVYIGVRAYLTKSLERSLNTTAHSIEADYLAPLEVKGPAWFQAEMSESYPPGISDPFVRIFEAGKVLYDSGDMRDPPVRISDLPHPTTAEGLNDFHRTHSSTGQPLMVYTVAYTSPNGRLILVETGASMEPLQHLLHSLFLILLIATPGILFIAAVGGYMLMARPLRPVVALTEQAEHVGRKQMGERLPIIPSGDELERLSLALNRMIDRLEEALAHNQRFSADASHELRTPLTIIRGELEALLQMPALPAQAMDGISSALEEGDRMSRIVHSLMTISRLDAGGERMEMVPVELASIVRVTLEHMSLLAEEKSIALSCQTDERIYVTGDVMRLKQIVVNLVDNAIKYTPTCGAIAVQLFAERQRAVLIVSDTGIGIPAEALPAVFERFYRTDQARSRVSGGTGLGLAIVKAICGSHDGTLSIESVEGKSTTLRVELPLLQLSQREISDLHSIVVNPQTDRMPSREQVCEKPAEDLIHRKV